MTEGTWDTLIWSADIPTFSALPAGARVAYAPGTKISARPGQLAARAAADLLQAPLPALRALRRAPHPKELVRAAMWTRSAAFFAVNRLVDQDQQPAWSSDVILSAKRRPAPVAYSPDDARARCVTVIIAQDRAEQLGKAIASVLGSICDHVLVVDGGSVDNSIEVAQRAGARVVSRPFDRDFAAQRNFATDRARELFHPSWIAVVDSDEIVTPELAALYLWIMQREGNHDAVYGPMMTMAGEERWDTIDYRPMLFRPSLRYVGAGNERITSVRPLFIPIGGPMVLNVKTRAQFLKSRLLYADLRPGVVPPDVLDATRAELAELAQAEQARVEQD